MKFYTFFLICLIFFFLTTYSLAQSDNKNFFNITINDGLPNNIVHCIHQSSDGWIWLGTSDGLLRFDGHEYKVYKPDSEDSTSLRGVLVRDIYEDSKKRLWIATDNGGLNLFSPEMENFKVFTYDLESEISLSHFSLNSLVEDTLGRLWIGSENGLNVLDYDNNSILKIHSGSHEKYPLSGNFIHKVLKDENNNIWIGTDKGLDFYGFDNKQGYSSYSYKINKNEEFTVREIFQDSEKNIWLGTNNYGLVKVDHQKQVLINYIPDHKNKRSNTIRAIQEDNQNRLWLGTRGGLYLFDKNTYEFSVILKDEFDRNSLVHNSILEISKDSENNFWIGTRAGVSIMNPNFLSIHHFKYKPNNNGFLNNNEIYAILEDHNNNLWVGTEIGGLNFIDRKSGMIDYFLPQDNRNSISSDNVKCIAEIDEGIFLIGTFNGGLNLYNSHLNRFETFRHLKNDSSSISSDDVWQIIKDNNGHIWIATSNGVDQFHLNDRTFSRLEKVRSLTHDIFENNKNELFFACEDTLIRYDHQLKKVKHFNYNIRAMHQDNYGNYWMGTKGEGIIKLNDSFEEIRSYTTKDGLSNNIICGILQDNQNRLWISTYHGLSCFSLENEVFTNLFRSDGFQCNQFNTRSYYKSSTGELFFGGINGFNSFYPEDIVFNEPIKQTRITDIRFGNKKVCLMDKNNYCLENDIITIPYNHETLTIKFSSFNFPTSENLYYSFRLKNLQQDWTYVKNQNYASYSKLPTGTFIFEIKASRNNANWTELNSPLTIIVTPPFWKRVWFIVSVGLFFTLVMYFIIAGFISREKMKNRIVLERLQSKKQHELDLMKFQIFTDISHEIRTPLSLIISPLERLMQSDSDPKLLKKYIKIIHKNSKRLSFLIDQLLDYRKMEAGKLRLELNRSNIVDFIKETIGSFDEIAEEKKISLLFHSVLDEVNIQFDKQKLEIVIFNILSNAFKYTNNGGSVVVAISLVTRKQKEITTPDANKPSPFKKMIEISIKDTGVGIPANKINQVFERYYREENISQVTGNVKGTGIGLALSKELILLHKGEILVNSSRGKGSEFIIRIPMDLEKNSVLQQENEFSQQSYHDEVLKDKPDIFHKNENEENHYMLVVEDNKDMMDFLKSIFEKDFQILEASDGQKAMPIAKEYIPDIIISDIMMPKMDGNKFCQTLKSDIRTSHIPIILLTALKSKDHEKEGIIAGADDYITKPFDPQVLQLKVNQLLNIRKELRDKFSNEIRLQPSNIVIESVEERFLKKAINVIESNMANPDFGIETFARELGVSRMQLYRKMSALTNMTVKEFIRHIRLKRAAQLLEKGEMNISEIVYAVGFKHIGYFRKCFKELFEMNPVEYKNRSKA